MGRRSSGDTEEISSRQSDVDSVEYSSSHRKLEKAKQEEGDEDEDEDCINEEKEDKPAEWLDALHDPMASLNTHSGCMALADLNADGDHKLLVGTLDMLGGTSARLKVFKGIQLHSESALMEVPSAVCVVQMDSNIPRIPAIAVSAGAYVYLYRNLRPYFMFALPSVDFHPREADAWKEAFHNNNGGEKKNIDPTELAVLSRNLINLRESGLVLSSMSYEFLTLRSEEVVDFVESCRGCELSQRTVVTCMKTLKKKLPDDDAICCLVVGAESGFVYVLDPEGLSIIYKVRLPSIPVFLSTAGLYDIDYTVTVVCRDNCIYTIKSGTVIKSVIELESSAVGIVRSDKRLFVGLMRKQLLCFHNKNKLLFSVTLPAEISAMAPLEYRPRNVKACMVALTNSTIHIYNTKTPVCIVECEGIPSGIMFGRYDREDGALLLVTRSGGLSIKILHRRSMLQTPVNMTSGPPPEQDIPLNIPRKTVQYVDQAKRERQNASEMHRLFQRDLYLLRLHTAENYVKTIKQSLMPMTPAASDAQLQLDVRVQGVIGPMFKLVATLQNTGHTAIRDVPLVLSADRILYRLPKPIIRLPVAIPGTEYIFHIPVEGINPLGEAGIIRLYVCNNKSSSPFITATINMPPFQPVHED